MIIGKINDCKRYEPLVPGLTEEIEKLMKKDSCVPGRYEMEHGYYMIQAGKTTPIEDGVFETHKKYIDVQIVLQGEEILEWCESKKLKKESAYDSEKDVEFFSGRGVPIRITQGMCYILFEEDAHKACCHIENPSQYVKAVLKFRIG